MAINYDARGNEYTGAIDLITGQTFTDSRTLTATLGALNAEAVIDLNGQAVVNVDVRTAAGNLTVVFEGTTDGVNYMAIMPWDQSTTSYVVNPVITTTYSKVLTIGVTGFKRVRTRISAYTSGNVTIAMRATLADYGIYSWPQPSTLVISSTAAANTALTLTLPAAAGLFHYITSIDLTMNATAALAGTATLVVTSTNLPGSMAWSCGNAMAAGGTQVVVSRDFSQPLKSSVAGTATTIVMPAPGAAVLWRGNVTYYLAP